ncbi:hypothetical protein QE152_g35805 [Popillia japonica]|uniref:Uncharacterized protein n=1 Tax=Popillia japonica TaxID=7064 RepID=A0AAW1IF64_POPJA
MGIHTLCNTRCNRQGYVIPQSLDAGSSRVSERESDSYYSNSLTNRKLHIDSWREYNIGRGILARMDSNRKLHIDSWREYNIGRGILARMDSRLDSTKAWIECVCHAYNLCDFRQLRGVNHRYRMRLPCV